MGVSLWGFKSPLPHHLFTRVSEVVGFKKEVFKGFSASSMLENLLFYAFPWFKMFRFFIWTWLSTTSGIAGGLAWIN